MTSSAKFSNAWPIELELRPSRWLWARTILAAVIGVAALLLSGLVPVLKFCGLLALAYLLWLDRRYRPEARWLKLDEDGLSLRLHDGRRREFRLPVAARISPFAVVLGGGLRRRLYLFRDQCGADEYRRLCVRLDSTASGG